MAMEVHKSKTHVALLVSPGMGHLIPFLELANRLVLHHNLQATLFVVGSDDSLRLHKSSSVNIIPLYPSSYLDDPAASYIDKIHAMMSASFPLFRSFISTIEPRPVAIVVDIFGTKALAMARELDMLGFAFVPCSAWFLSMTLFFPAMDRKMIDNHANNLEPLRIPGCRPVRFEDTNLIFELNRNDVYENFEAESRELGMADGILLNTWHELEPTTIKALTEAGTLTGGKVNQVPIYPIGPLTRRAEPNLESEVLTWLDQQPNESVIYVSFGSGGTLCEEQITELAWGLELSRQRFVWVVRPPVETDSAGTYFTTAEEKPPPSKYLPEKFIERTKDVGLVVPMWGPQAEILSHRAVRGFVTHSGWNSTLESIVNGVAMVTWPLFAEQKMNAVVLTEEVGVAVRVRAGAEGRVVGREEIMKKVRMIMENEDKEGMRIREKMKELKKSGEMVISKGGSSYESLAQVAAKCESFRYQRERAPMEG